MLIGITGAPSKGKSTFFSAATMVNVPISPRPFTTIQPNKGATYVRVDCPCKEIGTKCNPKNSKCENGKRLIPMSVVDLAGLVPGAHEGKGLGNRFLDDVRTADVLIQIVDASGKTDAEGNPIENFDPAEEIIFLENEITLWITSIIKRAWPKIKGRGTDEIASILTGLKIKKAGIERVAEKLGLPIEKINWTDEEILAFSKSIKEHAMPIVIAANKIDLPGATDKYQKLKQQFPDKIILPVYADGELALRKASERGIVKYVPGDVDFEIINASPEQKGALEKIREVMKKNNGTGVQQVIDEAVFNQLKLIVVYPVSDENKYTDHFGSVLPDAVLVKQGTTAIEFAEGIHADLAKHFIFAVDARKKLRVAKDYALKDKDIIKIVSGKS
jgi:ribosome-binding ATPase YchF (GTP1/OBG family)